MLLRKRHHNDVREWRRCPVEGCKRGKKQHMSRADNTLALARLDRQYRWCGWGDKWAYLRTETADVRLQRWWWDAHPNGGETRDRIVPKKPGVTIGTATHACVDVQSKWQIALPTQPPSTHQRSTFASINLVALWGPKHYEKSITLIM